MAYRPAAAVDVSAETTNVPDSTRRIPPNYQADRLPLGHRTHAMSLDMHHPLTLFKDPYKYRVTTPGDHLDLDDGCRPVSFISTENITNLDVS